MTDENTFRENTDYLSDRQGVDMFPILEKSHVAGWGPGSLWMLFSERMCLYSVLWQGGFNFLHIEYGQLHFFLWQTFKFSPYSANISPLPIRPHEFTQFFETSVRKNHHPSTQLFSGHKYYPATKYFLVSNITLHITPLAIL